MDSLPNFLTHGAPLRAHESSANIYGVITLEWAWNRSALWPLNGKIRFVQSTFMILHALHNICTRKKRGKPLLFKAKLRSHFTLSRASYELRLACQHLTVPLKSKLTVCCESQFLLDSRFLISVQIENRVEDQVSWDRKQKFDPWLQDFLIISNRHNTTPHGLFVWATRIETRP